MLEEVKPKSVVISSSPDSSADSGHSKSMLVDSKESRDMARNDFKAKSDVVSKDCFNSVTLIAYLGDLVAKELLLWFWLTSRHFAGENRAYDCVNRISEETPF